MISRGSEGRGSWLGRRGGRRRRAPAALAVVLLVPTAAAAQRAESPSSAHDHSFSLEAKAHYRSSDLNRFPVPFPFPPEMIPAGQSRVFLETVDPGDHSELPVITAVWSYRRGDLFESFVKLDGIDRHDRNPTSSGARLDVDELWLRLGPESEPAILPDGWGGYFRIGKFAAFERQDDRHLESYGLVSTAFNRFEDIGLEVGIDLGRFFLLRGSWTVGNPLFLRDPNALAGDFGTPEFRRTPPDPVFNSGIPIPYDTDVDELDFDHSELGVGFGGRYATAAGALGVEVLAWHRRRTLAQSAELDDTFYGGDLDLLRGPTTMEAPFPISGDRKEESGLNVWLYAGGFSLFAQAVDQEVAGLDRDGLEVEAAWRIDLPVLFGVRGRQALPFIQPAVRFSELDPEFGRQPLTVTPSFTWDWEKVDLGLRVGLIGRSDLTVEVARNRFILASGAEAENDEVLATLALRWGR